jgi:hypothetical protein
MPRATKFPPWQLPWITGRAYGAAPTWVVVFLCQIEDAKRDNILKQLCAVDKAWTDRPSGNMRRLVEIPWISDATPSVSIIFRIFKESTSKNSLIFIDKQSLTDEKAIILNSQGAHEVPQAVRVAVNRANLILDAAQGKSLIDLVHDYEDMKILPEEEHLHAEYYTKVKGNPGAWKRQIIPLIF